MPRPWFRALVILIVIAVIAVASLWLTYQRFLERPLSIDQETTFVMAGGSSYSSMVQELRQRGWTDATWPWRVLGWLSGDAGRLKAGEYPVRPGTTPAQWLAQLVEGQVILYRFTIVEGWSYQELRNRLAEAPMVEQTLADWTDEQLMQALGREGEHPEGWFLPETYRFPRGTTDREVLEQAHRAMQEALDSVWAGRALGTPLDSPYAALILASIIEKETGRADERGQIAGVFSRRLQRGMRLQTDPTVIYGLGAAFDGDLRRRDLRTDTPYNTYTRHGLPPTPIALPGLASLQAAVQPEDGETLYFVARGDGSHQFSVSLEDHQRAVDRFQKGKP